VGSFILGVYHQRRKDYYLGPGPDAVSTIDRIRPAALSSFSSLVLALRPPHIIAQHLRTLASRQS
jgi:hypothetical protein